MRLKNTKMITLSVFIHAFIQQMVIEHLHCGMVQGSEIHHLIKISAPMVCMV